MVYKFFLTIALTLSSLASSLNVNVNLSPAGSFAITSMNIKGNVTKSKDKYVAKKITIPVKYLSTGMELRDKHTKERLDSSKYPSIYITDAIAKDSKGQAVIKIRNIKKPIRFTYTTSGDTINVKFLLSLKEFKIENISYMGIGVQDKIEVSAKLNIL